MKRLMKRLLWFGFGVVLALMITPAQIDKAQKLARVWKPTTP